MQREIQERIIFLHKVPLFSLSTIGVDSWQNYRPSCKTVYHGGKRYRSEPYVRTHRQNLVGVKTKDNRRSLDYHFPQCVLFLNDQQLLSSSNSFLFLFHNKLALNFFHNIYNSFFKNQVVVDICAYRSPAMMDCMFVKRLQTAQSDPDYAALFHGRPRRFVLPLKPRPGAENQVGLIAAYNPTPTTQPSSMAALAALCCR